MMNLETQIKLVVFSLVFGIFFALMIDINHKYLYESKRYFKIIFTFLFILINTILYFLVLKKINEGIIHIYSIICIILGFFIEHFIKNKVVKFKD